jgi:hypothetical protein
MMEAEESHPEWTGVDGAAWGEIDHARRGDPIHACVDFLVLLVILASAVGCLASAFEIW